MSQKENAKELNISDLSTATAETAAAKPAKAKKEFTAEDLENLNAGVEKMKGFGVSEDFAKILPLLPVWHLTAEEQKATKDAVAEAFGGSEKLKDYVDGAFQDELAVLSGMQKAISILNNVKSFYARRESKGSTKKVEMSAITISGEPYSVSKAYLAEISAEPKERKIELLLAHPATKKSEAIESL